MWYPWTTEGKTPLLVAYYVPVDSCCGSFTLHCMMVYVDGSFVWLSVHN